MKKLILGPWCVLVALPLAAQAQMLFDGTVSPVYDRTISLSAGVGTHIEVRNITAGGDPVLHLLDDAGLEMASTGQGVRELLYQPTQGGMYILVVRARSASTAGVCDLYQDGTELARIRFGGWFVTFSGLQQGEEIETVQLPNGPKNPRLYVMWPGTQRIVQRVMGGGTDGAALYTVAVPGTFTFLVGGGQVAGPGRVFRNDARLPGHDQDGDGLGSNLERYIGTCDARSGIVKGFDCSKVADARDTDGDGLNDAWELRGRRDVSPHQPLPLWGADPRHKDVFFEVDFMLRNPAEKARRMTPEQARSFASYFQDEIGTLTPQDKAAHAASLGNPDGKPGIHVHLDIGMPPESEDDATLYGDWGGHNWVPAVWNQDIGDWVGADYTTAWLTNMTPARFGVFRYMLPYSTGGGSNGPGYACASGLEDMAVLAHECGHAMGLWSHSLEPAGSPDVNCKPNHPSLMNYAYLGTGVGFADGRGRAPLNNASLVETGAVDPANKAYLNQLETIFGYMVDHDRGSVDWDRDGNFESADRRVRAYANYTNGGSCEYTRQNESRIGYGLSGEGLSVRTPAIARLKDRIYAFYIDSATPQIVKFTYSTGDWRCWEPSDGCGMKGMWKLSRTIGFGGRVSGIDAATVGDYLSLVAIMADGSIREMVLSMTPVGEESFSFLPPVVTSGAVGEPALESDGNQLLLVYKTSDLELYYSQKFPLIYRIPGTPLWSTPKPVVTDGGTPIATSANVSPGLGRGSLQLLPKPNPPADGFYGAFADPNGYLDLWYFDARSNRWQKTEMFDERPGGVGGRPALAYAPRMFRDHYGDWQTSSDGGKFYVVYTQKSDHVARMMLSYVRKSENGGYEQKVGLNAYYDNVWWAAYGLELLPDYDKSGSFFALAAITSGKPEVDKQVWIRPRSDGLLDYTYSNRDDWAIMGSQLCRLLREPVGILAPAPQISCPE